MLRWWPQEDSSGSARKCVSNIGRGIKLTFVLLKIVPNLKSAESNSIGGASQQIKSSDTNGVPLQESSAVQPDELPVTKPTYTLFGGNADSTEELNLWRKAFSQLSERQQKTLADLGFDQTSGSAESDIDNLVTSVNAKQKQVEDNMWSAHVGGREVVFRQYTTDIVSWLTKAGDIAVQFAPPQAAVPWSVLKGLLNVSNSLIKSCKIGCVKGANSAIA
jgi:hypothetical protein